jgi:hypothetical protein
MAVCEARAAGRAEGKIADYAPYREFYALFDGVERYTICDDEADAAARGVCDTFKQAGNSRNCCRMRGNLGLIPKNAAILGGTYADARV